MSRRGSLFVVLALAGCASPGPVPAPYAPPPPAAPVYAPPAPSLPVAPPTASGDMTFDAWSQGFFGRAVQAGIPADVVAREMAGLTPLPRVSSLDSRQPEFSKPVSDYIRGVTSADRIAIGQRKRFETAGLADIEQRYGVPRDVLVGIWAMESGFGAIQGDFDVIRSMATLAADGRRRAFAEEQLIAALRLIASGEFTRARLRGSWAGAMGQTQFIPATFLATAVDGDGDGRRDIWGSSVDALASAANLLSKAGWVRGQGWAREVTAPPGFDFSLTEGPRETPAWWAERGLRPADGLGWSAADQGAKGQLVAPAGASGPLFLLLPNHFVIRRYNNSLAYALGVGLLADRFAGAGPLITAWPQEVPLSLADRMTAQRALARLGFDPGPADGVVGLGTRTALRGWQKQRGLTADGYLTPQLVQRLAAEAGAA
ncbi:lytic murein transglycosylase [Phenylobacterium immobile]|uniref:lytic murein transglycosylase n=1 Tax=Phenylobacterium immobile TaxID=21 RepID=UPI000B820B85|nr:lytic murein transglycosylase [Phenylobacterium immobile]